MRPKLKSLVGVATALLLATATHSEPISPKDAYANVGSYEAVEGVVSQVSVTGSGTTFINFGGRYPNHVFYGVIFRSDVDKFKGVEKLEGRTVLMHGPIDLYEGKPQIILRDPSQVEVVD